MKTILCSCLMFAAVAHAQDAADRAAITRIVASLNQTPRPAGLFLDGVDVSALDKLNSGAYPRMTVAISHEPWGEAQIVLLSTRITAGAVQFITPDVAVADGVFESSGADGLAPQRVALLFVMKKDGANWRIALVRPSK